MGSRSGPSPPAISILCRLLDVQNDIKKIAVTVTSRSIGLVQADMTANRRSNRSSATNDQYIAHHNGPQYFGYVANNPEETKST